MTYGFNIGAMSGGIVGAEFDFGYTPSFFGKDSGVQKSGVMTMMGSLIAGIPVGGQSGAGIRPYGMFGVGLLRRKIEFGGALDDISSNDFGYNVGGGIMGFFTNLLGVRGEYLEAAFYEMETAYGTVENYFAEGLGIDAEQQRALRDLYLGQK